MLKNILKNLCVSLVSIIIILVLFEIILRLTGQMPSYYYPRGLYITDKTLGYRLKPNFNAIQTLGEYTYRIEINSDGLRDKEFGPKKFPRILSLGDSFTFGTGLDKRDTYLAVLDSLISSSIKSKYEIINAGVPGYGTGQELDYLKLLNPKYKPDVVLIGFCIPNDPDDNIQARDTVIDGFLVSAKTVTCEKVNLIYYVKAFLRKNVYMYSFITNRVKSNPALCNVLSGSKIGMNIFDKELQFYKKDYSKQTQEAFKATFAILKELKYFTDKEHIKLTVILIPTRAQVDTRQLELIRKQFNLKAEDCDVSKPTRIMISFLKEQGVDFLDLSPALRQQTDHGMRLYYVLDGHWNKKGAVCAGSGIFNHLADSGYLSVNNQLLRK